MVFFWEEGYALIAILHFQFKSERGRACVPTSHFDFPSVQCSSRGYFWLNKNGKLQIRDKLGPLRLLGQSDDTTPAIQGRVMLFFF